ncbi:hypothetical protein D3C76_1581570 [compost metagenome]
MKTIWLRGMIQLALRWNTVKWLACFATSGTYCTALAAAPILATFLPVRSRPSGHWAEWNAWPAKVSRPLNAGMAGLFS